MHECNTLRQKDDRTFAQLLNRLQDGNHASDDIDVLIHKVHQYDKPVTFIPSE